MNPYNYDAHDAHVGAASEADLINRATDDQFYALYPERRGHGLDPHNPADHALISIWRGLHRQTVQRARALSLAGDTSVGSVWPFFLGLPLGGLGGYFLRRWQEGPGGQAATDTAPVKPAAAAALSKFTSMFLPQSTTPKTAGDYGGPWLGVDDQEPPPVHRHHGGHGRRHRQTSTAPVVAVPDHVAPPDPWASTQVDTWASTAPSSPSQLSPAQQLYQQADLLFWQRTGGYKLGRTLDPNDPTDAQMIPQWRQAYADVVSAHGAPAPNVSGPWLDIEPYVGGPWLDIEQPMVGGPWLDFEQATVGAVENLIGRYRVVRRDGGAVMPLVASDDIAFARDFARGAQVTGDGVVTIYDTHTGSLVPLDPAPVGDYLPDAALDAAADDWLWYETGDRLHHKLNPHNAADRAKITRWRAMRKILAETYGSRHHPLSPQRVAGDYGQHTTIGAAIDDVRSKAESLAARRAGNVIGVIHTSKDGVWHTLAFRAADDADDWLNTATQDPTTYTYAAYFNKEDPSWPHAYVEKISGMRAPPGAELPPRRAASSSGWR